jgi:hypothetical protein
MWNQYDITINISLFNMLKVFLCEADGLYLFHNGAMFSLHFLIPTRVASIS